VGPEAACRPLRFAPFNALESRWNMIPSLIGAKTMLTFGRFDR
jgi:hypothetical protein